MAKRRQKPKRKRGRNPLQSKRLRDLHGTKGQKEKGKSKTSRIDGAGASPDSSTTSKPILALRRGNSPDGGPGGSTSRTIPLSSATIFGWVPRADLRCRHAGLAEIAKKELKLDVTKLKPGEMVMFINSSWTGFVLYCANNVLLHHKRPDGKTLNIKALMVVPQFMEGQRINYEAALKATIETEYQKRHPRLARQTLLPVSSVQSAS